MFKATNIARADPADATLIAEMVGELLREITTTIGEAVFRFDHDATESRAQDWLTNRSYAVFLARNPEEVQTMGFLSVYESYGLYAGGRFGTIPEVYVRAAYRSRGVGAHLLREVKRYGETRGWTRLEVTTPPLPQFERTMKFYRSQGFQVSGGRKLKVDLP
ncbi:MAG: GNAT family N-acetyltransferase [Nitrospira sp.]|nr:GNAT family N-acetyltransferase [Nitrospira sp.]